MILNRSISAARIMCIMVYTRFRHKLCFSQMFSLGHVPVVILRILNPFRMNCF